MDSAFCFFCRAFPTVGAEGTFTTSGFKKWGKAIEKFNVHQKINAHKEAQAKVLGYKQSLLSNSGSIIGLIDKHHSTVVTENREYLKCILKTLLYCSKQGIAIRGHNEESESLNKGNFLELLVLTLRAKDNNIIKRFYFKKEKTFNYVHHSYLNMFLTYMSDCVLQSITILLIQSAKLFSVLIDETQYMNKLGST